MYSLTLGKVCALSGGEWLFGGLVYLLYLSGFTEKTKYSTLCRRNKNLHLSFFLKFLFCKTTGRWRRKSNASVTRMQKPIFQREGRRQRAEDGFSCRAIFLCCTRWHWAPHTVSRNMLQACPPRLRAAKRHSAPCAGSPTLLSHCRPTEGEEQAGVLLRLRHRVWGGGSTWLREEATPPNEQPGPKDWCGHGGKQYGGSWIN